tara:strand:- start:10101 stop:10748 length:648 start_codon:yes stop_codon:yes gene_type:complete
LRENRIVLIDIGIANIYNLKLGFEKIGYDVSISSSKNKIMDSTHIVLPGVGAFGEGMKRLDKKGLIEPITECAKNGKPLFGICLGMQLLFASSEEDGFHEGLSLIPGKVIYFKSPKSENEFKIPHMTWNTITCSNNDSWKGTLLESLSSDTYMYFVHSLFTKPDSSKDILATTKFGYNEFCSVVINDNIMGCQFHPERSAHNGLKILENFIKLNK